MKTAFVVVLAALVAVQVESYDLLNSSVDPGKKVNTKPVIGVEPTIIGGTSVTQGQFKWMVAYFMDFSKFCSGTLITTTHILTAAHCISTYGFFELYMGSVDYTDINLRISYTTSTKFVHPNFTAATLNNDVGLLFVPDIYSDYFTLNQIAVVRLPALTQENFDFAGSQGTATGWGKVTADPSSPISPTLNAVNLQVLTNTECRKYYSSKYIIASTLCAYGSGTKAICNGDSGGPLHVVESDGNYTQIAISSFTSSYSCLTYPNGFARVMAFKSWIMSTASYTFRTS